MLSAAFQVVNINPSMIGNAMKKSDVTLRGIVVAADSRQQAEESYRAVATGVSVKALMDDENNFIILSNADSDLKLMNPLTGNMSLVEASDDTVDRMEFCASDSDAKVETFYTVCSTGCNSHIIADDPKLMARCTVCASELKDLSLEEIEAIANSNQDDNQDDEAIASDNEDREDTAIIATASTKEGAVAAFHALATGEIDAHAYECGCGDVLSNVADNFKFSPYTGEAANAVELDGELKVEANSDGEIDANWYCCANDECGLHVIASTDTPIFCTECSSGLIDPVEDEEAVASEGEEDESDLDGDAVVAGSTNILDDIEDEDEAIAGAKCEDCGKAKCECDEDGDDEDEDEDDDDSDEDDLDDDNTLSVSTVSIDEDLDDDEATASDEDEGEATAGDEDESDEDDSEATAGDDAEDEDEGEATAGVADDEGEESESTMVSIETNLMSLASAAGELNADDLEVAYAGNISGQATWMAFHKGQPVATVVASNAEDQKNIFGTETFANLVMASAQENGVIPTFKELGFQPIVASVDVEQYVQDEIAGQVEAQVAEAKGGFTKNSDDYAGRFEAALATAATGINNGFFKDIGNPVKGALVSALASVGVNNSEPMIAKAFANNDESYLKSLIGKAKQIMAFDVDVQNQLTAAVSGKADEQTVIASDQASSGVTIGKPVDVQHKVEPKQVQQIATASTSKKLSLDAVLGTLGQKRR